ncbi:hypothetical protein H0H87_004656, partial [Tephrocybe sp. NHM501043]
SFFAYRIYRLSNGYLFVPFMCWLLSLLRFGGGFALVVESYLSVPHQDDGHAFAFTDKFGWLITMA